MFQKIILTYFLTLGALSANAALVVRDLRVAGDSLITYDTITIWNGLI